MEKLGFPDVPSSQYPWSSQGFWIEWLEKSVLSIKCYHFFRLAYCPIVQTILLGFCFMRWVRCIPKILYRAQGEDSKKPFSNYRAWIGLRWVVGVLSLREAPGGKDLFQIDLDHILGKRGDGTRVWISGHWKEIRKTFSDYRLLNYVRIRDRK
jgi:hypothetical protein